jgi:hypothetical protein
VSTVFRLYNIVMNRQITEHSTPTQKQAVVNAAIGSVRLEGFEPSESALNLMDEYVNGHITVEELQTKALEEAKATLSNPATK